MSVYYVLTATFEDGSLCELTASLDDLSKIVTIVARQGAADACNPGPRMRLIRIEPVAGKTDEELQLLKPEVMKG
jgi:hypothetical protein